MKKGPCLACELPSAPPSEIYIMGFLWGCTFGSELTREENPPPFCPEHSIEAIKLACVLQVQLLEAQAKRGKAAPQ